VGRIIDLKTCLRGLRLILAGSITPVSGKKERALPFLIIPPGVKEPLFIPVVVSGLMLIKST
jgi:hypothetical protein